MSEPPEEAKQNFLLRQAREERALSQKQVAEAIGVDERSYRRWETEGYLPGWYAQRKLLTFFGKKTPEELGLRGRSRGVPPPPQLASRETSEEASREKTSPPAPSDLENSSTGDVSHKHSQPVSSPLTLTHPHPNSSSKGPFLRKIPRIGFILAVFIIVGIIGSFFLSSPKTSQQNSNVLSYPPHTQPSFDDTLQGNTSHAQWTDSPDHNGTCTFKQGSYHVIASMKTFHYCIAQHTKYTNMIYAVQMTFFQASEAGLIFGESNGNFSVFLLFDDGIYGLYSYDKGSSSLEGSFTQGKGPLPPALVGQAGHVNLSGATVQLAVIVRENRCDLYVNQHLLEKDRSPLYLDGHIGVFAGGEYNSHTVEMTFNNARVWT